MREALFIVGVLGVIGLLVALAEAMVAFRAWRQTPLTPLGYVFVSLGLLLGVGQGLYENSQPGEAERTAVFAYVAVVVVFVLAIAVAIRTEPGRRLVMLYHTGLAYQFGWLATRLVVPNV